MTVLAVVVVLLTVVTAGHLLLTFALIRRVRVLQERGAADPVPVPVTGSTVGAFRVPTLAGQYITDADVGDSLVVFVSPSCEPCGTLTDSLLREPPGGSVAVFVVDEPGAETTAFAQRLTALGPVAVVADEGGPVGALGVTAFPTVVQLHGGVVRAAGIRMKDLGPQAAAARP